MERNIIITKEFEVLVSQSVQADDTAIKEYIQAERNRIAGSKMTRYICAMVCLVLFVEGLIAIAFGAMQLIDIQTTAIAVGPFLSSMLVFAIYCYHTGVQHHQDFYVTRCRASNGNVYCITSRASEKTNAVSSA